MFQSQWPAGEWEHICEQLEELSTHDLTILATDLGIQYGSENAAEYNDEDLSERDMIIASLQQADPEELIPTVENMLRQTETPIDTLEE